jgi:hypothetical protein
MSPAGEFGREVTGIRPSTRDRHLRTRLPPTEVLGDTSRPIAPQDVEKRTDNERENTS